MARRRRHSSSGLEVTAFINLIVVLVPFLLSTTVFTRMAVLDLALPAPSSSAVQQLKVNELQLELVIHPDRIDVADRLGGLIERIAAVNGRHDVSRINALMVDLKSRFPDKNTATLLAQPDTPYEHLVQVMDAMRERVSAQGAQLQRQPLFPDIAIGDAPVSKKS